MEDGRMTVTDPVLTRVFNEIWERAFGWPDGEARQALWVCEPSRGRPWQVGYTTSRIEGGPHDGKFAAMAYKPVGKDEWKRVYFRGFSTRKAAKKRALQLYVQHSKPSVGERFASMI